MSQFVIHLGPHKTGTTYLQASFVRLRRQLRERGTHYPDWWGGLAHGNLLRRLLSPPDSKLESQFAELRASDAERTLISIEGLVGLPEKSVAYLRDLVDDSDVILVFYTRSWADVLSSIWREIIKEGATVTLPEFLYRRVMDPWTDLSINFDLGLRLYEKYFGSNSLHLVSYDQMIAEGCDLFSHFASSFLGWDEPPALHLGRVNASLSAHDTEIVRALNSIECINKGKAPTPQRARLLGESFLRLKPNGFAAVLQDTLDAHTATIGLDERTRVLQSLHEMLFAKYNGRLVSPRPHTLFFRPRRIEVAYVRPEYVLRPGVVDALHELYEAVSVDANERSNDETDRRVGNEPGVRVAQAGAALAATQAAPPFREVTWVGMHPVTAADDGTMTEHLTISFRKGGNSDDFLAGGWSAAEREYRWSAAPAAELHLPATPCPGDYLLSIQLRPFVLADHLPSQRFVVDANGARLCETILRRPSEIRVRVPATALASDSATLRLRLSFPDAARPTTLRPESRDDRLLGCAFERLTLVGPLAEPPSPSAVEFAGDQPGKNPLERPVSDTAVKFESLGENCEFGLVQRRCGIEPLGLLRFSSTPLPPLLKALRARFAGMGRPEFIEIEVSHSGTEYMVFDKRFHFRYHAWVKLGEQAPEEIHARECRRLPLLVRKLIEDLTEGNKIFVYRGIEPLAEAQARELAEAIGAYGPGTLLWVERADAANPPGAVIRLGPTLLKGHIDRFAPPENAHDLSLDCWIAICRNALALTRATVAA
jgi:hypothetical protein